MKKHLFTLMTSAACLLAGTAQAQCCCNDSFYVGALGGVNWINEIKSHGAKVNFDAGYVLGVNAGYRICEQFRVEGEFAYRHNEKTKHVDFDFSSTTGEDIRRGKIDATIKTYSLMANAYYDFDFFSCCAPCLTPYIGAGIGYAWNDSSVKVKADDLSIKLKGSDNRFAWQAMAGLNYRLCENVRVGVEYRFFNPAKKLDEQALVFTVGYDL
jgi:opacity protein-like surface antigen